MKVGVTLRHTVAGVPRQRPAPRISPDRTRSGRRAHRRQLMLLVIIDGVELAEYLRHRIRAVVIVQRHDVGFFGCLGVVEGLLRDRATRGGIHHFLQALEMLQALIQLQGRQRVVLMIGERIMDGALIAVISREVEHVVVFILQRRQQGVVRDGRLGEAHGG